MSLRDRIPFLGNGEAGHEKAAEGLAEIRGDMDAVAMIPYDDGTFWFKPANFDKELIGGQGGYETPDGDKIALDGDGQPARDFMGVTLILAVDPTEHAAAVEPIKALVAQKDNIGEWIRVDREANIVQLGPAIKQAADSAVFADRDSDEHWRTEALSYDAVADRLDAMGADPEDASDELVQQAVRQVEANARERAAEADGGSVGDFLPWVGDDDADGAPMPEPVEIDIEDSLVGDKLAEMGVEPEMASDEMVTQVMQNLAESGDLTKVYDIAPPAAPAVADGGGVELDEATHIAVDQSKAADLIPKTTSTVELQTAIDKARNEERDDGKLKEYMMLGIILGAAIGVVFAIIMVIAVAAL
jgi:hypothetical protein